VDWTSILTELPQKCTKSLRRSTSQQWRIYGMAGMAHAMGATLLGAQNLLGKIENLWLAVSSISILLPIQRLTAQLQRPSNAIIRACCASTKHCNKLCYCNTTQRSDIATEQERSLAISTKPHSVRYKKGFVSQFVPMRFRQEDVSQNVVVTSLSQCFWESDYHANNCS